MGGNVQKSPSSKAAAVLTRGAYASYVSTAKGRERRWRLFSTFPNSIEGWRLWHAEEAASFGEAQDGLRHSSGEMLPLQEEGLFLYQFTRSRSNLQEDQG